MLIITSTIASLTQNSVNSCGMDMNRLSTSKLTIKKIFSQVAETTHTKFSVKLQISFQTFFLINYKRWPEDKKNVLYKIKTEDCESVYIGLSRKTWKQRKGEHVRFVNSREEISRIYNNAEGTRDICSNLTKLKPSQQICWKTHDKWLRLCTKIKL